MDEDGSMEKDGERKDPRKTRTRMDEKTEREKENKAPDWAEI